MERIGCGLENIQSKCEDCPYRDTPEICQGIRTVNSWSVHYGDPANIVKELKCGYCFTVLENRVKFFSSFVFHLMGKDDIIPVFCNEECLLRWAAIRKGVSLEALRSDFKAYVSG